MNLLTSRRSWLLAPVVLVLCLAVLVVLWASLDPKACMAFMDNDDRSPFELMTLPLFGLIIPLVWLAPPVGGSSRRQCGWCLLYSLLGFMALVREQDWHKMLFAHIWPDVAESFPGTVFKMRFLRADMVPLMPKLFVLTVFVAFFVAVMIPLVRYTLPLVKGFFRREATAWTGAMFGLVSVMALVTDRLPANLRKLGIVDLKDGAHASALALCKVLEEGGEMIMALLALLLILQAHLIYGRRENNVIRQ